MYTQLSFFNSGYTELPVTDPTDSEGKSLQSKIDQFEPVFLENILGYEQSKLLTAAYNDDDAWAVAFVEGAEYTALDGTLQKWQGFKTEGKSAIALYVYCIHREMTSSATNSTGESTTTLQNGSRVSPEFKIIAAWNEMVKLNFKMHEYIIVNQSDFAKYIGLTTDVYNYNPMYVQPNQNLFIAKNSFGL